MGTRSTIIVQLGGDIWRRVYCHWDGYPEHHGPILLEHYAEQAKAEALVAPGDMSSLAERCDKPEGHSYESPVDGCTVYYGRDRGEHGTEPQDFASLAAAWPDGESGAEYVYVWRTDPGAWFVGDADEGSETMKPLADVMAGTEAPPLPAVKAFGGNFVVGTRKPLPDGATRMDLFTRPKVEPEA